MPSALVLAHNHAAVADTASVEFDPDFLRQFGTQSVDLSRYSHTNPIAEGIYPLSVAVNQHWLGRLDIRFVGANITADNVDPCVDSAALTQFGVDIAKLPVISQTMLETAKSEGLCVPITRVVPDAVMQYDHGALTLDISIPQLYTQRFIRGYVSPEYWDDGLTAGLLHYDYNVYYFGGGVGQGGSATQSYLGLKSGFNTGPWRFRHRGNFSRSDGKETRYQNLSTYVQRSIAPLQSQLTVGDFYTDGSVLSSVGLRGVKLATDDRMMPNSQRGFAPVIRGVALTNAKVQIKQGGNIIYETTVAPGAFEIDDMSPTGYGGDFLVTVLEADGRSSQFSVPFAALPSMLRPGALRYSLALGKYRDITVHSSPTVVHATVQRGMNNNITLYGGLAVFNGYSQAEIGFGFNTYYGAFGLDIGHTHTDIDQRSSKSGDSVRLSYSKLVQETNTNLTLGTYRFLTNGYLSLQEAVVARYKADNGDVGVSETTGYQRSRIEMSISQALGSTGGSMYLVASSLNYWNQPGKNTQFQFGYSNFYKQMNYGVSVVRQRDTFNGQWDTRVMFNIGIPLGSSVNHPISSSSFTRDTQGNSNVLTSVHGVVTEARNVSYGVSVADNTYGSGQKDQSVSGNFSYTAPYATIAGSAGQSHQSNQLGLSVSGGIVAYEGGVILSQPLGDTIGIVEADHATGARIDGNNGLTVNRFGRAVVPYMTPFTYNEIAVNPKGLPLHVEMKSTMQKTVPTAGAIVKVQFDTVNRGRAVLIRSVLSGNGAPLPYGAQTLDINGDEVGIVGQGGQILLRTHATSGELRVHWGTKSNQFCILPFTMPEHEDSPQLSTAVIQTVCQDQNG